MKKKQKSKLAMYQEVIGVMEAHHSNWAEISEIKKSYEDFLTNNDEIVKLRNEHEKDLVPFATRKSNNREELINQAVPICNLLQVFAYDIDDDGLRKKIDFSRNKLNKSKDSELSEKCKAVLKTAKQVYSKSLASDVSIETKSKKILKATPSISSYGLTGQMIENLEKANKDFIESVMSLKDALTYRAFSEKKISEKIKDNDKLLSNKIDKLISLFETSQTEFYRTYNKRRILSKDELGTESEAEKKSSVKPTPKKQKVAKQPVKKASQPAKATKDAAANEVTNTLPDPQPQT